MLSYQLIIFPCVFSLVLCYAPIREPSSGLNFADAPSSLFHDGNIPDLHDMIENMNMNKDMDFLGFSDNKLDDVYGNIPNSFLPGRTTKHDEFLDSQDYDVLLDGSHPVIRDPEYLEHSTLWGPKNVNGGGAEPPAFKGTKPIPSGVKTDAVLPAYCNPPNPCPVGYTSEDGCLETFENTAAFSRAYQASQDCMCDSEHMFSCPSAHDDDAEEAEMELTQQNYLSDLVHNGEHKGLVAKKFYNKAEHDSRYQAIIEMAREASQAAHDNHGINLAENPFLVGPKLPVAAKKGHHEQHVM